MQYRPYYFANYAAFNGKLEQFIESCVGQESFATKRDEVANILNIDPTDTLKNPIAASMLFGHFLKSGHKFPLLDKIIKAVDVL